MRALSKYFVALHFVLNLCVLNLCAQGTAASQQQFQQALDAQKRGDYDAAIRQYRNLLKTSPGLVSAWVNLGVSLVQTGRYQEAVHSYQSALALTPDNTRIQYYLALAYFKSGDAANAARGFEQLLHASPADFHLAALLATTPRNAGGMRGPPEANAVPRRNTRRQRRLR